MGSMLLGLSQTVGDKIRSFGFARRSYPTLPAEELGEVEKAIEDRSSVRFEARTAYTRSDWMREVSKFRSIRSLKDLKLDHAKVRLAARTMYFDSLLLRSAVDRCSDLIVADGIRLECTPDARALGRPPEELDDWARETEERFDEWMSSKSTYMEETLTGYQTQRFALTQENRDGEYFSRVHYQPEGIRLGFLEQDQIKSGTTQSGKFHDGVIRGRYGEPRAYHVYLEDGTYVDIPAKTPEGKPLILHGYMPQFAGQTRGISRIAHCIEEAERLADYQLSELHASVAQSQFNGFIKPSDKFPSTGGGLEDLAHSAMPALQSATQSAPTGIQPSDQELANYHELPEIASRQPGAMWMLNLGAGETLEAFKKSSPTLVYPAYVEAVAQYIASSMSMPLSVLKMLFSENYSGSRGELQLFWKVVNIWRAEMVSDFLAPLYSIWLPDQIARGEIQCPGFSDPRLRRAWLKQKWYGSSLPQLDPNKQAQADKVYIEMGATTLKRVAQEYNGSNAASNRAALKRELPELTPTPWSKTNGGS